MKVLLSTLNAKYIHINLAVRLLYELNHECEGLDWKEFTIKEDKDGIADICKEYDVVAFSCYIWNITQTLQVCKKIKALNPDTKILLGGPEVSYDWKNVIEREEVDYIITGEGEIPFKEFLENFPSVENVPNLVFKTGEGIKHNPEAPMFDLKNFANLRPYRNDAPSELYNKVCYIETSRGCPYKCEFCLASLDNKVRYLPIDDIKANLLYLMQNGRVIKFLDRTFNIKKDFTIDMFKFILEHHRPENVFQFEITADIVHPDIIAFIQEHVPEGLFRFEIGIQTVNQKANLQVSRKQNFEKTKGIIQQLQNKIEMHLDLIVGLPLDEWEDIKFSFEEVFRIFAPELQLGFLKFLKGTPVRDKHEQHGYVFDPEPPYQIIESNYLSKDQLAQIVKLEEALEIYWNKKRAVHTLKYVTSRYSIFDFMLGLGKHFEKKADFHKHSIIDVYEIMHAYADENYSQDRILKQLIAVDYYLQAKVKPKPLFIEEVSREERNKIITEQNLNHHKFRYIILPLNFDFHIFEKQQIIEERSTNLILQYTGTEKAAIVSEPNLDQLISSRI
jgi:anaerobic magnesium-protoporphyrin IX monomethyl ester cyclase